MNTKGDQPKAQSARATWSSVRVEAEIKCQIMGWQGDELV